MLARDAAMLRAAILLVPHHGSKTSSTPPFIDAVAPSAALFSVGYRNRFRHPHEAVLERYAGRGVAIRRTDAEGALHVRLPADPALPLVIRGRNVPCRYWSERPCTISP
jgi:competence protein ComEC